MLLKSFRVPTYVKGLCATILFVYIYLFVSNFYKARLPRFPLFSGKQINRDYETNSDCDVTRGDCPVIGDGVIYLVVVACSGNSENTFIEAITMIKSATIFTRSRLNIHVFTTNLEDQFKKEISMWPAYVRKKFELSVHFLKYPLDETDLREMKDWWGPCASFRLFLPTVMNDVDAVLYVDTDVIFLGPVDEIWNHFSKFNDLQVGALAPRVGWDFKVPSDNRNFILMPSGKLTQVNSGVFLMNLTRMREPVFKTDRQISNKLSSWRKEMLLPLYRLGIDDMHGDQNLINTVFHHNPERLYYLACKYNYHHKFCFDRYSERFCTSAEKDGAFVIHGNANTYYNNYAPAFRAINYVMKQYNFEKDKKKFLLDLIRRNLDDPAIANHEHCGNKTDLFIKILSKSIEENNSR